MNCIQCGTEIADVQGPCNQCGWDAAKNAKVESFRESPLIGRYHFIRLLGHGRLGSTFVAQDAAVGNEVVVKVIHPGLIPGDWAGNELMDGVRSLMTVAHPTMTRILDVDTDRGFYFIVSEFLEGVPLRDLIENRRAQGRGFALNEIHTILHQLGAFLTESGVEVHGAICPESLMILPRTLKILDAGLADNLPLAAVAYALGTSEATACYLPPEMKRGRFVSQRSDVFSVGVLMGEMLTQLKYDGRPETFTGGLETPDEEIETILRRALLSDPRGRFADVAELIGEISAAIGVAPPAYRRPGRPSVPKEPSRASTSSPVEVEDAPPVKAEATVQVSMEDVIKAHMAITGQKTAERPSSPLVPKRPQRRDSVPPPKPRVVAPPPKPERVDDPPPPSLDETPPGGTAARREVTQEIDLDSLEPEAVEEISEVRDVTQEIDAGMIMEDPSSRNQAVAKLEAQAVIAEQESDEELVRMASRLDGVDPRFVRAAHKLEVERRGGRSKTAAAVLKQKSNELDGIDPRLLRAAARLEDAKINDVPVTGLHEIEKLKKETDSEEWEKRLAEAKEDSVISFLAPPMVDRSPEVKGFPITQQRGPRNRPPTPPPRPPAPLRRKSKGPENMSMTLYDDSGETDDESQPTAMLRPSRMPQSPAQLMAAARLRTAELALPIAAGLFFAGMIICLALAASL